jgi:hypothetical protein
MPGENNAGPAKQTLRNRLAVCVACPRLLNYRGFQSPFVWIIKIVNFLSPSLILDNRPQDFRRHRHCRKGEKETSEEREKPLESQANNLLHAISSLY